MRNTRTPHEPPLAYAIHYTMLAMQYRVEAKIRVGVRGVNLYSHHCDLAARELRLEQSGGVHGAVGLRVNLISGYMCGIDCSQD